MCVLEDTDFDITLDGIRCVVAGLDNPPTDVLQYSYPLTEGQWFHLSWVYSVAGDYSKLFINGEAVEEVSGLTVGPWSLGATTAESKQIGHRAFKWDIHSGHFIGAMNDFYIDDRALSDAEIFDRYADGARQSLLPVPTPSYPSDGLTVYTTEPDLSFWLGAAQGSMTFEIDIQVADTQMSVCNVPARPSGLAAMSFATSACDPALVAGETYRWRVRSTDGADVSAWSDWALFTTNGPGLAVAAVPSYPADSLSIYTSSPTLHWYTEVDNTGIDFEAWYLKRTAGAAASCGAIIDDAAADSVSTTGITNKKITGLEAGATYDWCVRSIGDNGAVDSDVATFTIANGWVSNATFTLWPTSNQIVYQGNPTLYWFSDVSSDPVTSYEVKYCVFPDEFGGAGCTSEDGLTDNQYQLTGLAEGAQVTWRVRSTHASGLTTDWDNAVSQGAFSVYGDFGEPLATPWYPIDDFMVYGTSVRFTWYVTGAVGVPSYEVQYSSNENFPDNDSTTVATSDQAVLDVSDLNEGWTYYWRVRVSSDGGVTYGPYSAAASFEVSGGAPMPRIGGPAHGVGIATTSPTLSWVAPPATDVVYDVRYASEDGAYTEVTDLAQPYVQVQNLTEGSYTWQVRSRTTDGSFTSPYSASGRFTAMASMSVDTEEELDLPVAYELGQNYPNPFNPQTTIPFALPSSQKVSLVVYDMLGRQLEVLVDGVMSAGNHQAVWNAQNMPSGMYVYRLATPNGVQTKLMQLIK